MSVSSPVADGSGFGKLHLFPPKDVAVELSLMDGELLRKISPDEIKNGAWMDKCKKHELAPNILTMVQSFNRLALLVPTEVLEERTPQSRSKVITAFIQIANKCYCLHNYNSLKAIIAGLQCTPIHRLKKTWKEVPSKRRKQFKELSSVVSEDRNWETYSRELHQQLSSNTPFIPFLGVFLTQIVQRESYEKMRPKEDRRMTIFETYTILDAITARNKLDSFMHMRMRSFDIETPSSSDSEDSALERNGVHNGNGSTCPLVSLLFQTDGEESSPNGICSGYTQCSVNQQPAFIPKLKQKQPPIREASSPCENQLPNKRKRFAASRLMKSISAECLIDALQEPVLKATTSLHDIDIDLLSCSDEDDIELETPVNSATFDTTQSMPVSFIHQSKSPCPPGTRRRNTAAVHRLSLESSDASPPDMLAKYQFMSLGLSSGCESRPELRAFLTNHMPNSEGLNYKLSYEREPE